MRSIVKRSDVAPMEMGSTSDPQPNLSDDDLLFLELLKTYHRNKKYQYMQEWWERFESVKNGNRNT